MRHSHGIPRPLVFGLLVIPLAVLVACSSGVSQSEHDSVKKQLATQQEKAANLEKQLSDAQAKAPAAASPAAGAQQAAAGVSPLIGVKQAPIPTPPPPPTPAPPGATPAPRPVVPASYDEPVNFSFYVETLATTTVSKFGFASTVSCTPNSVFKRGMKLVWRFEVFDTSTGKRLTEKDAPTIKVRLPHGDELTARFSQRAGGRVPDAPWMWNAAWDIPLDYPVGGLDYTITVTTRDGRTGTFITPALISADTDSRVKIIG